MKPWIILAAAALALAGCADPPETAEAPPPERRGGSGADLPQDSTPEAREVRARVESYCATFSERDWVRFSEHFWPGATLTTVWMPPGESSERVVPTTVEDFVLQAPEGPGSREIFEERASSMEIRVDGGLAQVWARYAARFGDPGEVMEWEGLDAFTLLRHDGEWRITSLAYVTTSE